MTEPRRWPALDADEESFVQEFAEPLGMLRERMRDCPPVDVLRAAQAGVLPEDVQRQVSAHAARCTLCQAASIELHDITLDQDSSDHAARVGRRVLPTASRPIRVSASRWPRAHLYAIAASLVAITVLGAWVVRLQRQTRTLAAQIASPRDSSPRPATAPPASPDAAALTIADLRRQVEAERARARAAESALATPRTPAAPSEPQTNVPLVDLEPIDALRSQAVQVRTIELLPSTRLVTLLLLASRDAADAEYVLEIRDAQGQIAWQGDGLRKSPLNTFSLVVPATLLPTGDITLRLYGVAEGRRHLSGQYAARVVR